DGATHGAAHYLYLVAGAFKLAGIETQSIRLVSAGMGLLAVVAAYLAGDELFGRRMGLVAAFLIAVSSWAVTLSRFGMYATMSTPLFALLSVAFALRSLRTQRMADYALTGLWVGLGLCFYTSFRLFVPVLGLFFVYWAVHGRLRVRTWPPATFWLGLAIMSVVAGIVVAPLAVFALKHPDLFWARIETTFILANTAASDPWLALWENVRRHLLMFNVIGDPNGRHNLPGNPMLDAVSAALLVLGVAYALRRVLQPRYLLLVAWLFIGLLPGILSLDFEAPQSLRANGALPAAYLLVTTALAVLLRAWALAGGRYYPRAAWWPVGALLALTAALNFNTYF
ncbi:MAG: glycosyltransferase family 39 protein, partial [Caldilineaceae bacterium]|nr:glycosyltransferase family 39 protein [Caldilineaceae bacterium]